MANAPPPPGWGPPGHDPYAADDALKALASELGLELLPVGDVRALQAWAPFQYVPRFDRAGRELRGQLGELTVQIVELFSSDPLAQVAGEQRFIAAFVRSAKLPARAAVRSKQSAGIADDVSRQLSALGGLFKSGGAAAPPPGALLGDPTLEAAVDLVVPSREEGNLALPMPLRRIVAQPTFRGILELRQGGLVVSLYDYRQFDAHVLRALLGLVRQIHDAAVPPG